MARPDDRAAGRMTTPTTPAEAIEQAALDGVKSVSSDGHSATARPISELIDADKHLAARSANVRKKIWPVRMMRLRPRGPGA